MAATIAIAESLGGSASRPTKIHRVTVAADASYTTGGYDFALPAGNEGQNIVAVIPQPEFANTNGKLAQYDYAADKLLLLTEAGVEVGNGVDLSSSGAGGGAETIVVIVITE